MVPGPLRVLAVHRLKRGRASGTEAEDTGHPEPPTADCVPPTIDLRLLRASRWRRHAVRPG